MFHSIGLGVGEVLLRLHDIEDLDLQTQCDVFTEEQEFDLAEYITNDDSHSEKFNNLFLTVNNMFYNRTGKFTNRIHLIYS